MLAIRSSDEAFLSVSFVALRNLANPKASVENKPKLSLLPCRSHSATPCFGGWRNHRRQRPDSNRARPLSNVASTPTECTCAPATSSPPRPASSASAPPPPPSVLWDRVGGIRKTLRERLQCLCYGAQCFPARRAAARPPGRVRP